MKKKFSIFPYRINNFQFSIYLLVGLLLIYFIWSSLKNSLIFKRKDRLNIVFYGAKTAFYSFGFDDGVSYFISFPADVKVLVPGGYGYYRLGALGKLVGLEKKPQLYKKSFSAITSSFVDVYFYPSSEKIFFGEEKKIIFFPSLSQILFCKTNVNILDRAYIFSLFLTKQKNQFLQISNLPINKGPGKGILDERVFFDSLIGLFYHKSYRSEKNIVQIVYTKKEKNALFLTKIIEGQGIRVVDYSYQRDQKASCRIIEDSKKHTQTAAALKNFFNCSIIQGNTGSYDIIFKLGSLEGEWATD